MKPCLHPSIVTTTDLQQYLDLAQRHGYEWVDIDLSWANEMDLASGETYVDELFASRHLSLASFGLPVDVYAEESVFNRQLAALPDVAERAFRLGATRCCTWLWPSIDERPVPYASRLARRFRQCAIALMPYGIRLGLEFVGPHHLRNKTYPFVQNLDELMVFLEAVGAPNVGVLLDSYHWYTAGETAESVQRLKAHQIVHVHINDTLEMPEVAHDGERLLPGAGQIDLVAFLGSLDAIGYHGPISIEVLHQAPLDGSDEEIAQSAFQQVTQQIKEAQKERQIHV